MATGSSVQCLLRVFLLGVLNGTLKTSQTHPMLELREVVWDLRLFEAVSSNYMLWALWTSMKQFPTFPGAGGKVF